MLFYLPQWPEPIGLSHSRGLKCCCCCIFCTSGCRKSILIKLFPPDSQQGAAYAGRGLYVAMLVLYCAIAAQRKGRADSKKAALIPGTRTHKRALSCLKLGSQEAIICLGLALKRAKLRAQSLPPPSQRTVSLASQREKEREREKVQSNGAPLILHCVIQNLQVSIIGWLLDGIATFATR